MLYDGSDLACLRAELLGRSVERRLGGVSAVSDVFAALRTVDGRLRTGRDTGRAPGIVSLPTSSTAGSILFG